MEKCSLELQESSRMQHLCRLVRGLCTIYIFTTLFPPSWCTAVSACVHAHKETSPMEAVKIIGKIHKLSNIVLESM